MTPSTGSDAGAAAPRPRAGTFGTRLTGDLHATSSSKSSERAFRAIALLALTLPLALLAVLIVDVVRDAAPRLSWDFLTSFPSRKAELAGIKAALVGTCYLMVLTAAIAIPMGVGAAIYLEEYAKPGRVTQLIELNISNLAGVPSIIYGLLGLELFVRVMHMGRSLLAGACTLALLLLPMIVTASREALRTVPRALREASYALGAGHWSTIQRVVLPMSLPGVLTGVILSLARAIGETAPLITIGALTYVAFLPKGINDAFTAMPIQIFNWVSRPQSAFKVNAAAGIVVLLALMLILNGVAIWLRARLQRRITW
jgi:phosphate transport system permease protein